jgi:DNA-binding CsgD family transcriptional regulator/tetratricopeptide (TPR) repeat protein
MPAPSVARQHEMGSVSQFLVSAKADPFALVIAGEPGIGKTTLWLAALDQARASGFTVLTARAAAAESVMAYASLADLLGPVDTGLRAALPPTQQRAIDRVLMVDNDDGPATDQRAIGAAFLTVVERLAALAPVLLAIDDVQWLDPSSLNVLRFAARRLSGPVGVLCTVRTESDSDDSASWLQLPRPEHKQWIRLWPLRLGGLQAVLTERVGRSFTRPTLTRIHALSGGNPFYAIELARAVADGTIHPDAPLPGSLAELVRERIATLNAQTRTALLAAACVAAPTVRIVADAMEVAPDHVVALLKNAEERSVIGIDGDRLRFTHPLLAHGIHADAPAARRRAIHQRLAEIVEEPEVRARHLALAATGPDTDTLEALDGGAGIARSRGAPDAAAELLEFAIKLGGDTAERRILLAGCYFDAGEPARAREILEVTIARLDSGPVRAAALNTLSVVGLLNDNFQEAADHLERALADAGSDLGLRIPALTMLSFAFVNAGRGDAALETVEVAVADAERHGAPDLLSQALGMRAVLRFMNGDGLDEPGIRRAVELEDPDVDHPTALKPSVQRALLRAWTGQLDTAADDLHAIRRRCIERGQEGELSFIDFHTTMAEVWRGNLPAAAALAEDSVLRAHQLGGALPLAVAQMAQAYVSAYLGREEDARAQIAAALETHTRSSSHRMAEWPVATLGFLEVSIGNYAVALTTLEPLLNAFRAGPGATEIIPAPFLPDAVEAMIALGHLDDAEPLIDTLERNGRRLDRPWTLAVGARCRALLLAARGDVSGATAAALRALVEHQRLPMPFERTRTLMLLGQLQRRGRLRGAASTTLAEALAVFEELGTALWAQRAQAELARTHVDRSHTTELTASEQRVAELAGSGMTNRDVAAALFISVKTVEANLGRIYRKLAIGSRAELGRHMGGLLDEQHSDR